LFAAISSSMSWRSAQMPAAVMANVAHMTHVNAIVIG